VALVAAGCLVLLLGLRYEEGTYALFGGLCDLDLGWACLNSGGLFALGAGLVTFGTSWVVLLGVARPPVLTATLVPLPLALVVFGLLHRERPRPSETTGERRRSWEAAEERFEDGLSTEVSRRVFSDLARLTEGRPGYHFAFDQRWKARDHRLDLRRDEGSV